MSDRTSANSFVCTTSFLQTERPFIPLIVQDGINIGKKKLTPRPPEGNIQRISLCKHNIAINVIIIVNIIFLTRSKKKRIIDV